jgi:hypothetical protein
MAAIALATGGTRRPPNLCASSRCPTKHCRNAAVAGQRNCWDLVHFPDNARTDEATALPSPQVVLSCGSTGTTAASDAHPASGPPLEVLGYRAPRSGSKIRRPPGRGGPPRFPSSPSTRSASHTPGVPRGCFRLCTASVAFTLISGFGTPCSRPKTDLQRCRRLRVMLRTASSLPFYMGSDAGLRPGPFPGEAASLRPGLLAATRTRPPPGGDEPTNTKTHHGSTSRCHLPLC